MIDVTEHVPMAVILAKDFARRSGRTQDTDEIISDALFGLLRAAEMFDPSLGVKFTTYAQHKIRWEMVEQRRLRLGGRSKFRFSIGRLDDFDILTDPQAVDPSRRRQLAECLQPYMRHLNRRERDVCRLHYAEGLTQREIARELGINPSLVSLALREIHEKLRKKISQRSLILD